MSNMEAPVAKRKKKATAKGKTKKKKKRGRPPKPKKEPEVGPDGLTEEQRYQRDYYRKHRKKRSKKHKERWRKDREYREREIQRQREKRAEARKATASERFEQRVEEKRQAEKPTRKPRLADVNGRRVFVYGTGSLAREVGREDATIRAWLAQDVLPGASVWIARRAHFTVEFSQAVRNACKRLYEEDGRGNLDILAQLVRAELRKADVSYVPETDGERVQPEDIEVEEGYE